MISSRFRAMISCLMQNEASSALSCSEADISESSWHGRLSLLSSIHRYSDTAHTKGSCHTLMFPVGMKHVSPGRKKFDEYPVRSRLGQENSSGTEMRKQAEMVCKAKVD